MSDQDMLINNYIIIEQIGSGSFGDVYLAKSTKLDTHVAAKIESKKDKEAKKLRIKCEYKIYKYLHRKKYGNGLPTIYDYIETPNYNTLFMQLLGNSLEDIFEKMGKKFKLETVFFIADQIIFLLNKLHDLNFIHRDIKPNNFLVGKSCDINNEQNIVDNTPLYIMDFGLSKMYVTKGKHMPFDCKRSLIGTARYTSLNMHNGIEPSRRDDLESVGYMLVYFLKGKLPWQGLKKKSNMTNIEVIGEVKMCTSVDTLCEGLPQSFAKYINYCRNLKFTERPNYAYCRNLFKSDCKKLNIYPKYEWL